MTLSLVDFNQLVTAEDYLNYFQIVYDPQLVNVNRLHILKKFSQLIREVNTQFSELSETEKLDKYREALQQAYEVFLTHSPLETKLFKVFQHKPSNIVMLNELAS